MVCDKVVCERWYVTMLCVKDGVCACVCDKVVCDKVVCDKARAEEEEEDEEEEEEDADGIQNQKQKPHTKMWGTTFA